MPVIVMNRIIVVDDDVISLKLIHFILCKANYIVKTFHSGREVCTYLAQHSLSDFSCIISDFRMSEMDGLELFRKLNKTDPDLSTILFSADGNKELISRALKNQVFDFLEKPLKEEALLHSVKQAVMVTAKKRLLRSNDFQVQEITGIHNKLSQLETKNSQKNELPKVNNVFYPLKETGGDFMNLFQTNEKKMALLAGDVSGHDLKAGFISTYCQGMVRGMVNMGASLENIAKAFNDFLLKVWNKSDDQDSCITPIKTSLSICFLSFDLESKEIRCLNNGFPHPIMNGKDITVHSLSENGSPLGWFEDCAFTVKNISMPSEATIYFWSDGLEDFSKSKSISCPSVAYYLVHETDTFKRSNFVKNRKDDLLVVEISWGNRKGAGFWYPLFNEEYFGNSYENIDKLQEIWGNSLRLIFSDKKNEPINEILLCLREGVLNALLHGCKRSVEKKCCLRATYCPVHETLHIEIEDQGCGFDANLENFNKTNHQSLGILIMQSYSQNLVYTKGGRQLTMDFTIKAP